MSNKSKSNSKEFDKSKIERSQSLPQYGKKGHKPRKVNERSQVSLDDIQTNDIRYWNKTAGFESVTKFNWDLIVGRPRSPEVVLGNKLGHQRSWTRQLNPPAIMQIDFYMGCGYANSIQDGVNRGLAMLMSKIRASLSTSNIGFETADLGIYLTSTASIAAFIGYAKRILESYTVWKDRNYAYPRALISVQGATYEDIRDNINVYAAKLNAIIDQYNAMNILDTFDIFDRQYSMCHNVFADEDSEFGQLYVFVPANYYIYNDAATPSHAKAEGFDAASTSFTQILGIIQSMIDAWYTSSDMYQINGTLLRAFKEAPRQIIPYYNLQDVISPVVDRAFLMQIMNCTIIHDLDFSTLDITQDPLTQNYVIWKPMLDSDFYDTKFDPAAADYQMLRLFENDVTQDDCMELTRLLNFVNPVTRNIPNVGSEIVKSIRTWTYDTTTNQLTLIGDYRSNRLFENPSTFIPAALTTLFSATMGLTPFRYIPTIHTMVYDTSTGVGRYFGPMGDIYNWMLYSREDWDALQFVAYQSLWTPKNL